MELADFLLDPLRSGIGRRALAEVALLGAICGPLAFWIVSEQLSYAAESLAHGLLPGLVIASLAGAPLLLSAAGGVLAGIVGALLAVPTVAFLNSAVRVLLAREPEAELESQESDEGKVIQAEPDDLENVKQAD